MGDERPFDVLGIAPTQDLSAIKRAYFARLGKTPPHSDPSGFRALRRAYEELCQDDLRTLAWLRAPVDLEQALADWQRRFAAKIAEARARAERAQRGARLTTAFVDRIARTRWADLKRHQTAD